MTWNGILVVIMVCTEVILFHIKDVQLVSQHVQFIDRLSRGDWRHHHQTSNSNWFKKVYRDIERCPVIKPVSHQYHGVVAQHVFVN